MSDKKGAYLFVCFQDDKDGNDVEELFYGVSLDGYNFRALNGNKSVFKSNLGTMHMRDPFAFKGNDGSYYIVATDMNRYNGWASQSTIVIYRTQDFVTFDKGVLIDYSKFEGFEDCNRAWAPQAIWSSDHINPDGSKGAYMIYLSLQMASTAGKNDTVMYKSFATDLMDESTYTAPELLIIGGDSGVYHNTGAIDGDIVYDSVNERWLMYFGGRRISESVTGTVEGPYKEISGSAFDVDKIEGSNIYQLYGENKWIICADGRAFGTGFRFAETSDFKHYKPLQIDVDYTIDFTPRHGYVIHISNDELNVLMDKFGKVF